MDNERKTFNLVELLNQRKSFESNESFDEWTCQDCSIGHLILMIVAMILTYLVQISGFVLSLIFSTPNEVSYHKSAALTQPYFERIQVIVIAFLVHFQFLAFYSEPSSVLMLVSKELKYSNITMTIITGSILLSNIQYTDQFVETFHMNALAVLVLLTSYAYVKLYKGIGHIRFSQMLGFNVLYSFILPFLAMEFGETTIRVTSFYTELAMMEYERVVMFACFYFVAGLGFVYYLKDVYMGFGCFFNLLGIFVVQSYNICKDYKNYCSVSAQVVSMLFAVFMVAETAFIMYRYPQAYCYQYKNKRF